eukprot:586124-Ditylum_brightwellii.AAC.1
MEGVDKRTGEDCVGGCVLPKESTEVVRRLGLAWEGDAGVTATAAELAGVCTATSMPKGVSLQKVGADCVGSILSGSKFRLEEEAEGLCCTVELMELGLSVPP